MCVCVCVCEEMENHIKFMHVDSGAKVCTLGGNRIGHCEEKSSHEHVSNTEWLTRLSCLSTHT